MGNCQDEFRNVPGIQQEWAQKERLDMSAMSVINRTHMRVEPQRMEDIKIGALRQGVLDTEIDNERLYDTRPLHQQNLVKLKSTKMKHSIIKPDAELQQLDFNFYHELALPDYSYRPLPQSQAPQFQELQIRENSDRHGVKYIGQWKNNQTHGNGIMTSNTKKYIGQFKNGLKHFHGREIEAHQVYEGEFQFGRRKGQGVRYLPDRVEQGTFDQTLAEGKIVYSNGSVFTGTLLHGQYHGPHCQYQDSHTKIKYQGQFAEGKMTGYGKIKYPNGQWYEGQLLQGIKHGKGQFYWKDQSYYRGNYRFNQRHGEGELKMDRRSYMGSFRNGMLDGPVMVEEGGSQTRKVYSYGKQIDEGQQSIEENGLPEHWMDGEARGSRKHS